MDQDLKNELTEKIKGSPVSNDLDHAEATLRWLLQICPDADLALQIAAFGHDVDRGVNKITERDRSEEVPYALFKQMHADRSAEILRSMLADRKFNKKIIDKVADLVKNHEVGGNKEADLLKDADSLAYFDLNIPIYLERNGEEKTRHKIHFMFDRASMRAQDIIKKMKFENSIIQRLINEEILNR